MFVKLGCNNPVAYCYYHKSNLSKDQMAKKECLSKQCRHLKKLKHTYWEDRERRQEKRKESAAKKKEFYRMIDTKKLIKEIEYCNACPTNKQEQLEYCSQCTINSECLNGLIRQCYEYLKKYETTH